MKVELTLFEEKHLSTSLKWMNDREICGLFNRVYTPFSVSAQKKWYAKYLKDDTQKIFAIEVDEVYVGNIGLKNINILDRKAEYFILIGDKRYWGRGVGTISTKKILDYIRENTKLHKIYLSVDKDNIPAVKLYEKTGFQKEGILREEIIRDEKFITQIRMAYFIENK